MESILGIILLILVIGVFAAAVVRPWVCFAMVVAYPVTEQAMQSYFPFFTANRSTFNFIVAGVVAITVGLRFFRSPIALRCIFHPILILIILLQAVSYASLLWTPGLESGMDLLVRRAPYSILYLVLAPLLLTSLDDFYRVRVPLLIICTVSLLLFVLGPAAMFRGVILVIHYGSGEKGNPGIVGQVGVMVLIFAVLSTYRGLGKWALPIQLGAGMFGLGMGLLSGTRGQVLVGGLVSFLFFPLSRKIKGVGSFFGIGFGMMVVLGILYFAVQLFVTDQNVDRWTIDSLTGGVTGRFEIAVEAVQAWLDDPVSWIFGRGAGAYSTLQTPHAYPHNFAIEALTELGLIGFTLYLLILVYGLRAGIGLTRMYKDDLERRSAVALLCGLVLFVALISLKQGTIHSPGPFYVWFLILGRVFKYESEENQVFEEEHDESEMLDDDEEEIDMESGYSHA